MMACPFRHACSRYDPEFCNNYSYEECVEYLIFDIVDRRFRDSPSDNHAVLRILDDLLTLYYDTALTIMMMKKKREHKRRFEEPILRYRAELGLKNFIKVIE